MPSAFEIAPTGRARCRGCGRAIAKGELRFGERMPNAFGEGEMTLWFHPICGALTRPEPFLAVLSATGVEVPDRDRLRAFAEAGLAHRRLPRLRGAERSPSGRARCRSCREFIEKSAWRLSLVYYEEGRFEPSGYIHAGCAEPYFETSDVAERIAALTFLDPGDLDDLSRALRPD